jgi:hypothetical protein
MATAQLTGFGDVEIDVPEATVFHPIDLLLRAISNVARQTGVSVLQVYCSATAHKATFRFDCDSSSQYCLTNHDNAKRTFSMTCQPGVAADTLLTVTPWAAHAASNPGRLER